MCLITGATTDVSKINNNLLYRATGTTIGQYNGTNRTWAQWQGLGLDANGLNIDPKFVTNFTDFHLQSSSPARNAGTTIATVTDD
jgi:hypothetical protein